MCPIVPTFTCGLLRSNFSFAILLYLPPRQHASSFQSTLCCCPTLPGSSAGTINLFNRLANTTAYLSNAELRGNAFRSNSLVTKKLQVFRPKLDWDLFNLGEIKLTNQPLVRGTQLAIQLSARLTRDCSRQLLEDPLVQDLLKTPYV